MAKFYLYFTVIFYLILPLISKTVVHTDDKHAKFVKSMKEHHEKEGEHNADFDHDVIWGDEGDDDDDEVSSLPPEEQKERLHNLVQQKIDADHDGYVTLEELTAWSKKSFDKFETEDTRNMFPEIDENKDGVMQWEEYVTDTYGQGFSESSPDFIDPPSDEWEDFVDNFNKDKVKFEASDLDKSGDLSLEEFLIFKHPRLHEDTRKIVIDEVLESSDLNGDRGIDLQEFLGDFTVNSDGTDPEWTELEKEKFEDELDANHDGLLTGDEIVQWMSPDNDMLAREEAEHLMDESDADRDGKLSVEEIVNNYVNWVDSDATDYGRQLLQNHDEL